MNQVNRYIRWYSDETNELVAEYQLEKVTLEQLQEIFKIEESDVMYDCWEVNKYHLAKLITLENNVWLTIFDTLLAHPSEYSVFVEADVFF